MRKYQAARQFANILAEGNAPARLVQYAEEAYSLDNFWFRLNRPEIEYIGKKLADAGSAQGTQIVLMCQEHEDDVHLKVAVLEEWPRFQSLTRKSGFTTTELAQLLS